MLNYDKNLNQKKGILFPKSFHHLSSDMLFSTGQELFQEQEVFAKV
jgi:hypothetical protein